MNAEVRGRFAPSPTARMHLGNARTALLAWLQVRALGGTMILRIEDLDPGRSRAEFERLMLDDLRWLGLDWDEGPDVGGPHAPYRQSERAHLYELAAERLDTYPCTCTRREVREAVSAPHGDEPRYPGTCRSGPTHPERAPALRWRVPAGVVEVHDVVAGHLEQDMDRDVGDVVLRRADGAWAYQLAVVVDDAAMGVTHVLRGADLTASTPRQVHLQRALGLPTPSYAHVGLMLGEVDKLSKRHGSPDLGALRAASVDPRKVIAWLAGTAGLDMPSGHCSAAELIGTFDPARLPGADFTVSDQVWADLLETG